MKLKTLLVTTVVSFASFVATCPVKANVYYEQAQGINDVSATSNLSAVIHLSQPSLIAKTN